MTDKCLIENELDKEYDGQRIFIANFDNFTLDIGGTKNNNHFINMGEKIVLGAINMIEEVQNEDIEFIFETNIKQ